MSLMLHRIGLLRPSTGDPVLAVPDAFDVDDWDIVSADEEAGITIHALPDNGGAAITDIEYRLDAGSWVSSGGTVSFTISGLTNDQEYTVELRAVNGVAAGAASDVKSATPEDAGSEWTPALVSAAVWIDPSDLGTLFQERTGAAATTPAVIDGVVGTLANKGTLGGYFIADGDANRPILRNSGDVFWLEFDGAGDGLRLTLGSGQTPATVTSICAWQVAGGAWGRCVSLSGGGGGDTGPASMCVSRNNTNLELRIESASGAAVTRAFTLDTDFVHTAVVSGTYRYARMDLGTPATATAGSTSFNFSLISYGRGHFGGDFIDGRFYGAILVFDTLEGTDEGAAIAHFVTRQGRSL